MRCLKSVLSFCSTQTSLFFFFFPLQKFLFFVLKSSDVLDILVPILYYLNDARADQCKSRTSVHQLYLTCLCITLYINSNVFLGDAARVGLMHIGVFILLLLSGERNFGVRLNKPYSIHVPMDIPVFTGTHADLLIVVRHPLPFITWNGIVVNCSLIKKQLVLTAVTLFAL